MPKHAGSRAEGALAGAHQIDRLNIAPIPTINLDWLQPHEGNLVDFLFCARTFRTPPERVGVGKQVSTDSGG
ncbi:MAG: hypothetical protein HY721_05595 [Planctomycetes bacterium]|nr:hypothetical protein [Planctomycetota bacterium]